MNKKRNIWLDGIMGLVVGDALGCPVQFLSREDIRRRGLVTGMEGYGTYNMPEGTWTDDSSMALATMDSIINKKRIDPEDIMKNFVNWEFEGDYTPFGEAFDEGNTCSNAIWDFRDTGDYRTCGQTGEYANGNGALMRILPVCLYYIEQEADLQSRDQMDACMVPGNDKGHDKATEQNCERATVQAIHEVCGLTHNHLRSKMACGLYYFLAKGIIREKDQSHQESWTLKDCLQRGMDAALKYYDLNRDNQKEMKHYKRLFDMNRFATTAEDESRSTGYVVDSLEAAVWCLLNTDTLEECLLKAVNLGDDTDTVAAIAGGLAGLYYGYDSIPADWLAVIKERAYVEEFCNKCHRIFCRLS